MKIEWEAKIKNEKETNLNGMTQRRDPSGFAADHRALEDFGTAVPISLGLSLLVASSKLPECIF